MTIQSEAKSHKVDAKGKEVCGLILNNTEYQSINCMYIDI